MFQYEPHKTGYTVAAKLQAFRGTLAADAKHRFNAVYASGHIVEAGCNTKTLLNAAGMDFQRARRVEPERRWRPKFMQPSRFRRGLAVAEPVAK